MPDFTAPGRILAETLASGRARQSREVENLSQTIRGGMRQRATADLQNKQLALQEKQLQKQVKADRLRKDLELFNVAKDIDPVGSLNALSKEYPEIGKTDYAGREKEYAKDLGIIIKKLDPGSLATQGNAVKITTGLAALGRKYGPTAQASAEQLFQGKLLSRFRKTTPESVLAERTPGPPTRAGQAPSIPVSEREKLLELGPIAGLSPEQIERLRRPERVAPELEFRQEELGFRKEKFEAGKALDAKRFQLELKKLENSKLISKDKTTRAFTSGVLNIVKIREDILKSGTATEEQADAVARSMIENLAKDTKADVSAITDVFAQEVEKQVTKGKEGPGVLDKILNWLIGFRDTAATMTPAQASIAGSAAAEAEPTPDTVSPQTLAINVNEPNFRATMKAEGLTADELIKKMQEREVSGR